jgi:hypothetical protein
MILSIKGLIADRVRRVEDPQCPKTILITSVLAV